MLFHNLEISYLSWFRPCFCNFFFKVCSRIPNRVSVIGCLLSLSVDYINIAFLSGYDIYLTPILQSIMQGFSKSCSKSCISMNSRIIVKEFNHSFLQLIKFTCINFLYKKPQLQEFMYHSIFTMVPPYVASDSYRL